MPHCQQAVGKTNEWYTPPHVFAALGCRFDVDVASPGKEITPWLPADRFICGNSLAFTWSGFVWRNPPFGGRGDKAIWLEKFFAHGNGIALVPDRTSAPWWQQYAPRSDLALFVAPKIKFLGPQSGEQPAQGTTLLALGEKGQAARSAAKTAGLGQLFKPI